MQKNDIARIRHRYQEVLWHTVPAADGLALDQAPPLAFDGRYWRYPDLDCAAPVVSYWDGRTHLERLITLLNQNGRERLADPAFAAQVRSALDYWLDHDFQNPNWWHNQIGIPGALSNLCLMLEGRLGEAQLRSALVIIGRGSIAAQPEIARWTGANLIWGAWTSLRHALLLKDEALLQRAVRLAAGELAVQPGNAEGIKADGGFFQHGPQLYSGGYGRSFTGDISLMAYLLSGTAYQFAPEQLTAFCQHVLDGQRFMVRGGTLDFNVVGREICRRDATLTAGNLQNSLVHMLATDEMPRKREIRAFLDACGAGPQGAGTKYFGAVRYLAHNRSEFHIGVRGNCHEVYGGEFLNGENELSYNLSYGAAVCAMRRGDEYRAALPVWDYARVPGTTTWLETEEALRRRRDWNGRPGQGAVCGGAAKGALGALYMELAHDGLTGQLAYIVYAGGLIALGWGIRDTSGTPQPVITTLNQCRTDGPRCGGTAIQGTLLAEPGRAVHNGGFAYYGLEGTPLTVERTLRKGAWRRNNAAESEAPVCTDLFTAYIVHGSGPRHAAYAYALVAEGPDTPEEASGLPISRIVNDEELAAVEFTGGAAVVVFRRPEARYIRPDGTVVTGPGVRIIVE